MSQENIEVLRETLGAFDRRDRAAWLALRDPDCEVIPSAMWPEVDAIRGGEAAWDFYIKVAESFERRPLAPDAEAVDAGPDMVLVHHQNVVRAGQAAQTSSSTTGSSSRSARGKSSATTGSRTGARPSPPGCGIRGSLLLWTRSGALHGKGRFSAGSRFSR